ncbi:NAD(P)/FAD-dependent oxidoreductase [Compostibacter hankyongensis]|uniref:NADH:ubiquinone reductase (non-electrogenic) n=1 Tax=Compostibacter hankyongensis TaxID=1007089 RepID=A0ABP8G5R6_9BACT
MSANFQKGSGKGAGNKQRVIVVGGGFAGLNFVIKLFKNKDFEVVLVDKNNYNYFTPLLYQVATSFLDPSSISYPFRKLFRDKGVSFRMAKLLSVDTVNRTIELSNGRLSYDHLVFASGSKTNFFGNEELRKKTLSLKGIDDAIYMRNELVKTMEKAAVEQDPAERKRLLTIVITGGGPTGVEVAGMLAEMRKYILWKDYPELENSEAEIHIVDGSPALLAPMSDKTHADAYATLSRLGVKIRLNTRVASYDGTTVHFSEGDPIECRTLIWAAGVTANVYKGIPSTSLGAGNRMITDVYNQVKDLENVWAIGDISIQETDAAYPKGHPQLAQPAIQQGKTLAKNFRRAGKGRPMKPFKYFDRGEMAIIGRRHAYADLFKHRLHLRGLLGLLGWLFIHLISLVNYNNKIKTLYGWVVAYFTKDQVLRMIFRSRAGSRQS